MLELDSWLKKLGECLSKIGIRESCRPPVEYRSKRFLYSCGSTCPLRMFMKLVVVVYMIKSHCWELGQQMACNYTVQRRNPLPPLDK